MSNNAAAELIADIEDGEIVEHDGETNAKVTAESTTQEWIFDRSRGCYTSKSGWCFSAEDGLFYLNAAGERIRATKETQLNSQVRDDAMKQQDEEYETLLDELDTTKTTTAQATVQQRLRVRLVVSKSTILPKESIIVLDSEEKISVGRDRTYERCLKLDDLNVSRYHATLYQPNAPCQHGHDQGNDEDRFQNGELEPAEIGGLAIIDVGSKHGTFINGVRVSESKTASQPRVLQNGDQVKIGSTTFTVHIHEESDDSCMQCMVTSGTKVISLESQGDDKVLQEFLEEIKKLDDNKSSANVNTIDSRNARLERSRKEELRNLKRKYGVVSSATSHDKSYIDRAKLRRKLHPDKDSLPEYADYSHLAQTVTRQNMHLAAPITSAEPDNKGYKMLQLMGWKEGEGLGTSKTGITEPIKVKANTNREGLG